MATNHKGAPRTPKTHDRVAAYLEQYPNASVRQVQEALKLSSPSNAHWHMVRIKTDFKTRHELCILVDEQAQRLKDVDARVAAARAEGFQEGQRRAMECASRYRALCLTSRDKAEKAGRDIVASHRQSDIETCEAIENGIRALSPSHEDKGG